MRVMLGTTVQTEMENGLNRWEKAEVELDETDLLRLLAEAGIDPIDSFAGRISPRDVFSLLETETEIELGMALVLRRALDKDTYIAKRDELESRKAKILEKIKVAHG